MDSANSGSIQSSSGGDDEYESRAGDVFPAIHRPPSSGAVFDPLSNLFDPLSTRSSLPNPNPNPLINIDQFWSRSLTSDQPPADLAGVTPLSGFPGGRNPPNPPEKPAGNPKKRPRASRRAPTTVLTTDTTNFRAMVQEFTGIPAPPFPRTSSRFDLFGTVSSTIRSTAHLDVISPQPYLLRPFAHKPTFLSPPPPSSSPAVSPANDLGLLNLQNPVFNVQNMFQSNKMPEGSSENQQKNDQILKMGGFEEFRGIAGESLQPERWVASAGAESEQGRSEKVRYAGAGDSSTVENVTARSEGMLESWICSSD